jgi:hypothetical protein
MWTSVIIEKGFCVWTNSQLLCIFCKILAPFSISMRHFCSFRWIFLCNELSRQTTKFTLHWQECQNWMWRCLWVLSEISLTYEVVNEIISTHSAFNNFQITAFYFFKQKFSDIILYWKQLAILLSSCTLFILHCEETVSSFTHTSWFRNVDCRLRLSRQHNLKFLYLLTYIL